MSTEYIYTYVFYSLTVIAQAISNKEIINI